MRNGEQELRNALLEEALGLIASANMTPYKGWKEIADQWILKYHALDCPNHEEVLTELLRMYNAASN